MDNLASPQFSTFKDCFARRILAHPTQHNPVSSSDSSELDEFSAYLAQESWPSLPPSLQTLSYETRTEVLIDEQLDTFLDSTHTAVIDTLISYGFSTDHEDAIRFLRKAIDDYMEDATAPPPAWSATRTKECEICGREVPLTYHHLIPRSVHNKVLKKGWHPKTMLGSVAWLCRFVFVDCCVYQLLTLDRPCHSVVHNVATNEELAREYFTIDRLIEREDIVRWRNYAAKQRFGVRRG